MPGLFDEPIERRKSDSIKWLKYERQDRDVIGAWVADMDFPSADKIIEAVKNRLDERVFGYTLPPQELLDVVIARLDQKYGWKTQHEWFVVQPGLVPSLFFATSCLGQPGDAVMAPTPNYHYFLETAELTDRLYQPLDCHVHNQRWELDFDQMATSMTSRTRAFLMCNPFNPVGRVLDVAELEKIAEICLGNGTMICSDEIHSDLVLDENRHHIPIASLDPEIERNTITLISPSKAFNLPGIGNAAFAIIPKAELRRAFEARSYGVATHPGALAYAAALAAYRDCDDWLAETVAYLRRNRDLLEKEVKAIPGISMHHVEATFLAWINVGSTGLDDPVQSLLDNGVAVSAGEEMGRREYIRLNFACYRSTLEEIIRRMKQTFGEAQLVGNEAGLP